MFRSHFQFVALTSVLLLALNINVAADTPQPNVLLIMTDDTGYGAGSTFGGVIPMPVLDELASQGLRYTNFNSTALCSPSRAARRVSNSRPGKSSPAPLLWSCPPQS